VRRRQNDCDPRGLGAAADAYNRCLGSPRSARLLLAWPPKLGARRRPNQPKIPRGPAFPSASQSDSARAHPEASAAPQTQKCDRECCSSDHCNSVVKLLGFDLGENPGGVTLYPMSPEAGSPPCRAVAAAALPFDLTLLGFAYC
jgi:hypothetical protein